MFNLDRAVITADVRSIDSPTRPPIEEMFTIQPRSPFGRGFCFIICVMAYFMPRKGPRAFTACENIQSHKLCWSSSVPRLTIVFSKASTDSSAILFCPQKIPALLTMLHWNSEQTRHYSHTWRSLSHIKSSPFGDCCLHQCFNILRRAGIGFSEYARSRSCDDLVSGLFVGLISSRLQIGSQITTHNIGTLGCQRKGNGTTQARRGTGDNGHSTFDTVPSRQQIPDVLQSMLRLGNEYTPLIKQKILPSKKDLLEYLRHWN